MAHLNFFKIDDGLTLDVYERDNFVLDVNKAQSNNQLIIVDEFDAGAKTEADDLLSEDDEGHLIIDEDESNNKLEDLDDNNKEEKGTDDKPKNPEKMHCSMCGFYSTSSDKRTYLKHMSDHSLNIPLLKCKYCSYQSFHRGPLSIHMTSCPNNRKLKKIECSQCNFHTVKYKCLNKHVRTAHLGETVKKGTYRCTKCDFRTKKIEKLREHRQELHPKEVLKCTICNFKCLRKKAFSKHKCSPKLIIRKTTIHQCDLCNYTSKYVPNIRKHREKHLKEQI